MDRFYEMIVLYEKVKRHFTTEPLSWINYFNPFFREPNKEPFILKAEFHPHYIDRTKPADFISVSRSNAIRYQNSVLSTVIYGNLYILYDHYKIKTYHQFNERCKIIEQYFISACNINNWNIYIERDILTDDIMRHDGKDYDFSIYLFKITISQKPY